MYVIGKNYTKNNKRKTYKPNAVELPVWIQT